jgi:hypothetical protein
VIRAPADGLVKTMHSHVSGTSFPNRSLRDCARNPRAFEGLRDNPRSTWRRRRGKPVGRRRVEFYAAARRDQAKEIAKGASTGDRPPRSRTIAHQHFSRWRILNRICTRHPQVFHIRGRRVPLPAASAGCE